MERDAVSSFVKRQIPFILIVGLWIVYTFIYKTLKQSQETVIYAEVLALIGIVGLDLVNTSLAFILGKKTTGQTKTVFTLFSVSFLLLAIADADYILTVSILKISNYPEIAASWLRVAFAGFFIFQFLSWIIIFLKSKSVQNSRIPLILYLPVIIVISIIFILFSLSTFTWKIHISSLVGLYVLSNTIFEVISFVFVLLCLAITVNRQIRFIATGYLIIIAASFFTESSYLTQVILPFPLGYDVWFLGLLLIAFGLNDMLKSSTDLKMNKWLNSLSSVQAQCAFWGFILCMLSITILGVVSYFLVGHNLLKMFPLQYLPSVLIVFSILAVLISSILARILSLSFERIEAVVDSYMKGKEIELPQEKDNSSIYEFKRLEGFLAKSFEVLRERNMAKQELFKCATQVAHDIRSPATSLSMMLNMLHELPEEKRQIVRNASQRINDIANNLLAKYRENSAEMHLKAELVWSLLDHLVSEKRFQMTEKSIELVLELDISTRSCFVNLEPGKFKRMISNLINNASEAIESEGIIRILLALEKETTVNSLSCEEEHNQKQCNTVVPTVFTQARRPSYINTITPSSPRTDYAVASNQLRTTNHELSTNILTIKIIDNGKGIPEDILPKIKQGGMTVGKKEGHGLGVSTAIQNIKNWGGSYDIQSKVGEGATFIIKLPIANAPDWFQTRLDIIPGMNVVILDDDESIHGVWDIRFQEYVNNGQIVLEHFHAPAEFIKYCENLSPAKTLFLIDYELLGSKETGLDLIEKLSLKDHAILVTSRYEEPAVRDKIVKLGIKTIPKNFAPYISLYVRPST